MKRKRLQYSQDEIITNLYTSGNEYMLDDTDTEYIGPYHKYTTGEIYTEFVWNPNSSKKLTLFEDTSTVQYQFKKINSDIKTKYENIPYYIPTPTTDDYKKGKINRYFLKKINEFKVFEVSEEVFDKHGAETVDPNLYTSLKIEWYISGVAKSTAKDGIYVIGTYERNLSAIQTAEASMPSISRLLLDPLQFYNGIAMGVIVPPDINQV